jgi:hypothetical protein
MGFLMMIKALPSLKLVPVLKKVEARPKSCLAFSGLAAGIIVRDNHRDLLWKPFSLLYGRSFGSCGAILESSLQNGTYSFLSI